MAKKLSLKLKSKEPGAPAAAAPAAAAAAPAAGAAPAFAMSAGGAGGIKLILKDAKVTIEKVTLAK
jgi:CO dehydrogenase/acetyl-CoA synthase beta subunit